MDTAAVLRQIPPTEAQTAHLPRRPSTSAVPTVPLSCPMPHLLTDDDFGDLRHHEPYRDAVDTFSALKPLVSSISAFEIAAE